MRTTCNTWAIYFVGFDETINDGPDAIEPFVGREQIALNSKNSDPDAVMQEARLCAFMRGGELLAVVEVDEPQAELIRAETEAELLRRR